MSWSIPFLHPLVSIFLGKQEYPFRSHNVSNNQQIKKLYRIIESLSVYDQKIVNHLKTATVIFTENDVMH